ncbi:MAG: Amine oxidase [Candidatus Roizmanbacteria bacterium GW2011_GWA2_35_19]|uniref:Amine oxidase n=2 Tax=Candidatus Roizmaniibacteriota TaxID=1752723 RepID=A0A0G0C2V2_9BACT|nr:MAG: Amine oxidase [Candidatus Roizmanbacteria bacterium GW2011_GWC2_35_12]KKP70416.1 MAG: Amine oxidase [Candidatus Roizmanbacteria bacterium GW2011_GWA2_35_19]
MKIAILGGGITGLTAAYCLANKGHQVTLIEKEKILGGLASGFKADGWDWYLERTYHHLFASDSDILDFAKEIGFNKIYFQKPVTASLYGKPNNFSVLPLDTPIDLLQFPYLNFIDKIRAGMIIAFLKISPFLPIYENQTSESFLKKTMGINVWNGLWQTLFRKKYGNYAGFILASFIWARIKKRTKALGYIEGGFQEFIDYLEKKSRKLGVTIIKGQEIKEVTKVNEKFTINGNTYDKVISTLPTPIMVKLTKNIFPANYLEKFNKLKYLHAVILILETENPILNKTYWLNICSDTIPFMILAQHTNFVDIKNYNNHHLAYVGWYVDGDSKLLKMDKNQLLKFILPYLKKITNHQPLVTSHFVFKAPFAQPIFDEDFVKNKPNFVTPDKDFFIANLDMTYPYDRGTNYAVKLGKDVIKFIK